MCALNVGQVVLSIRCLEAMLSNLCLILNMHRMVADDLTIAQSRVDVAAERYFGILIG